MCSHHIPKGCPVAGTDDPAWTRAGGSITYKDSRCLAVFNLRLLGWISSLREAPSTDTEHGSGVSSLEEV